MLEKIRQLGSEQERLYQAYLDNVNLALRVVLIPMVHKAGDKYIGDLVEKGV